ncbi:MAG: FTR1 family protein [Bdellovibrionota bacterium]
MKWIWIGLFGGVLGSFGVAFCAEAISNFAEGMGQELFNASVLILAGILIGFTVVWMQTHARSMTQNIKKLSAEIVDGKRPLYILAVIIGLSALREGSEVVLLAHGIAASGQSATEMFIGGTIGLVLGGIVGVSMTYGLLRAATKHIFRWANIFLIILSAGMISQAIGILQAATFLPDFMSSPVWDTSWLISEATFIGQTLHVLLGYTARPSGMQLSFYIVTILVIIGSLKLMSTFQNSKSGVVA